MFKKFSTTFPSSNIFMGPILALALVYSILSAQLISESEAATAFRDSSVGKTKILGGSPVPDAALPFQVYVEIPLPENPQKVSSCGGALIKHPGQPANRYKILTAAHCFDRILDSNKPSDKDLAILVLLGVNSLSQTARGTAYHIKFGLLKFHPNYDPSNNQHDLAIIPLPANFKPVPGLFDAIDLPPSTDKDKDYAGTDVQVAGWGETDFQGHSSDQLLFYRSKVLADDPCKQGIASAPEGFPFIYNDNVICTDGTGGKGVCNGDSGSPLTTVVAPSLLVGVSSFGLTENCEGSLPSYFTKIVKSLEWIQSTI